ncbi:MAG TPA: hypothetical protein VFF15_05715 [Flavobacteriaceae bacterium]|nr:hypothetical protein [Flavobacteriaceae bacterium]
MKKAEINLPNFSVGFFRKKPVKVHLLFLAITALAFLSCSENDELAELENTLSSEELRKELTTLESQLALLDQKTRSFYNIQAGIAQGWSVDATGYMSQMGHHYINESTFANDFDMLNPEALLYVPDQNGVMQFVGVEYLVFEDPNNIRPAPEGFIGNDDVWTYNQLYQAWTLHVWIRLENPNGIFAPLNPVLD